jgi:large subunit ribosomal protein L17
MRHGKKFNHLGRTSTHRSAMLSNMATSLILHKRISTTLAKAKELRKYVEPLLTKAKEDTTHSRRVVFSYLNDKDSVKILFDEVAEKISGRPGGYTRIVKLGNRLGDNSDMCIIELVDYNEALLKEVTPAQPKTRRSRRGGSSTAAESETSTKTSKEGKTEVKDAKEDKAEAKDVKAEAKEEKVEKSAIADDETVKPSDEESKDDSSSEDTKEK